MATQWTVSSDILQSSPQTSSKIPYILGGFILLLIGFVLGYILGQNRTQVISLPANQSTTNKNETAGANIPDVVHTLTPYPTYQPPAAISALVPSDWIFVKSDICDVALPVPPKKTPYYYPEDINKPLGHNTDDTGTGRYWQFEEFGDKDETTARVILRANKEGGNEVVHGAIEVTCSPNTGYTTETWSAHIIQTITSNHVTKVKIKSITTMWGKTVTAVTFEGGLYGISGDNRYYYLATTKHVYMVRPLIGSTTKQTTDTANQILNSLFFLE